MRRKSCPSQSCASGSMQKQALCRLCVQVVRQQVGAEQELQASGPWPPQPEPLGRGGQDRCVENGLLTLPAAWFGQQGAQACVGELAAVFVQVGPSLRLETEGAMNHGTCQPLWPPGISPHSFSLVCHTPCGRHVLVVCGSAWSLWEPPLGASLPWRSQARSCGDGLSSCRLSLLPWQNAQAGSCGLPAGALQVRALEQRPQPPLERSVAPTGLAGPPASRIPALSLLCCQKLLLRDPEVSPVAPVTCALDLLPGAS